MMVRSNPHFFVAGDIVADNFVAGKLDTVILS
jgi:hypothetical protein